MSLDLRERSRRRSGWISITALLALAQGAIAQVLPAPAWVAASDGTIAQGIEVRWPTNVNASGYGIARGPTTNFADARPLTIVPNPPYLDQQVSGCTTYYYWVWALDLNHRAGLAGGPDGGYARSAAALPPPTNVTASDRTRCDVEVCWDAVPGACTYTVYASHDRFDQNPMVLRSGIAATCFSDTTAPPHPFARYYWVSAECACGTSTRAGPDEGSAIGPPIATGLRFVRAEDCATNGRILVEWGGALNATAYRIYRGVTNSLAQALPLSTTGATTYSDTSVACGQSYWYWVVPFNACGDGAPLGSDVGSHASAPATPTGLDASDWTNCNEILIRWNPSACPGTYELFRGTSIQTPPTANTPPFQVLTTPEYRDTAAAPGVSYIYWVRARNACGVSPLSVANGGVRGVVTPGITTQPRNVQGLAGSRVQLRVIAQGLARNTYRWYKVGQPAPIGGNSDTLVFAALQPADAGSYYCVVTGPCGGSVTSASATVSIGATTGGPPEWCAADVDDGSWTGTPDGGVTIDDLLYYLAIFDAGDLEADVDDGSASGIRDGGVTIDDLLYYLARFDEGC